MIPRTLPVRCLTRSLVDHPVHIQRVVDRPDIETATAIPVWRTASRVSTWMVYRCVQVPLHVVALILYFCGSPVKTKGLCSRITNHPEKIRNEGKWTAGIKGSSNPLTWQSIIRIRNIIVPMISVATGPIISECQNRDSTMKLPNGQLPNEVAEWSTLKDYRQNLRQIFHHVSRQLLEY